MARCRQLGSPFFQASEQYPMGLRPALRGQKPGLRAGLDSSSHNGSSQCQPAESRQHRGKRGPEEQTARGHKANSAPSPSLTQRTTDRGDSSDRGVLTRPRS